MELHRIFFTAKGLQTLAIQTLRLKGEVHILLICLLQGILSLYTVQGTGTANAYASGVTNNGAIRNYNFTVPMNARCITTVNFMVPCSERLRLQTDTIE
jgi:hypothetical protein